MNSERAGSAADEVEDSIEGMASPRFPWDNIHDDKQKEIDFVTLSLSHYICKQWTRERKAWKMKMKRMERKQGLFFGGLPAMSRTGRDLILECL